MFDKEYVFKGKHADMVKRMTAPFDSKGSRGLFSTNAEIYQVAPIVGYLYNRKSSVDKGEDNTKIFRDKMMDMTDDNKYNYRLLMLLIDNKNKSLDERVNVAFKLDNDDQNRAEYDAIYDEYVLGGVEVIYEHVFKNAATVDEYIMNIYNFIDELNKRYFSEVEDESFQSM